MLSDRNFETEQDNSVTLIQDGIIRGKIKDRYLTNTASPQEQSQNLNLTTPHAPNNDFYKLVSSPYRYNVELKRLRKRKLSTMKSKP